MSTSVPIRWRRWPGLDHALAGLNQALRAEHQSQGSARAGHFGSARRPPGLWSLPGWNNLWSQEPSPEGSSSRDDIQALLWGYIHPHSGESGQEHFASYFFKQKDAQTVLSPTSPFPPQITPTSTFSGNSHSPLPILRSRPGSQVWAMWPHPDGQLLQTGPLRFPLLPAEWNQDGRQRSVLLH